MTTPETIQATAAPGLFPTLKGWMYGLFIFCLAVIFYAPSYDNEYALDDGIIIHQNNFVVEGITGIGDILTKDAYHAFYFRMNASDQLHGGRYRPMASISYAIEQEYIHPYRTGHYMFVEDVNHNGKLDAGSVMYRNAKGNLMSGYEYNDFVDQNNDDVAQPNECYNCWDTNRDFKNDASEDLNADGVFNEIDCQVYGARVRHIVNILLFAICCLLVYRLFSKYLLVNDPDLALLAALIFTIHPANSEVVANIRGRDDLFSMIFIASAFMQAIEYINSKSNAALFLSSLFFFLALMSKEYAGVLMILVPVAVYIFTQEEVKLSSVAPPFIVSVLAFTGMWLTDLRHWYIDEDQMLTFISLALFFTLVISFLFRKSFEQKNTAALVSAFGIAGCFYLAFRLNAVNVDPGVPDSEILNNPYLLATPAQAIATKFYVLLYALKLMVWPHPLISDYSYNTFAYRDFANIAVIFSMLFYTAVLFAAIILIRKKHVLGFALLSFFLFIIVVSNLFFSTNIMFLESFLFHANLGFALASAWLLLRAFNKISVSAAKPALIVLLILMIIPAGMKSWERSNDWKNDITLFLKDVNNAPNSVLVLGNAGARWIDLADTKEITGVSLPGQDSNVFNDYNGTLHISDEEVRLGGFKDKREAALNKGIGYLQHAVELHPRYVNGFLNLGLAYFKLGMDDKCILYWKLAERLYPNNPYLNNYYQVYSSLLMNRGSEAFNEGDYRTATKFFMRWTLIQPKDPESWYNLGGACFNLGQREKARQYFMRSKMLAPKNAKYLETLKMSEIYPRFPRGLFPPSSKLNKEGC